MQIPKSYIISTLLYGLIAVLGLISAIFFLIKRNWFLAVISALIIYVSTDNFFCGTRFGKACKIKAKHYILPPFFKK